LSKNLENRKRIFADAVTVDAWHEPFGKKPKVDLHVDVVFGEARLGGEADSPVRFRLRLKRAEVVVVVPETEPARVAKNSISRDAPTARVRVSKSTKRSSRVGADGHASGSVSTKSANAKGGISAYGKLSTNTDNFVKVTRNSDAMEVTQSQTGEGHYRWIIVASGGEHLNGRPWDGKKVPRLTLVDTRKERAKGIPPSVRVEIHCKREDLIIEDIILKDETLWQKTTNRLGFNNRRAAAESFIRERLIREGLEVKDMSEMYSNLALASVTAEPTDD
jgi:hypothetical protein